MSKLIKLIITLLTLIFLTFSAHLKAQLSTGDIALVGFNSDVVPDELAIVTLADIPSGQTIYISDFGWDGSGFSTTGSGAEGAITWTTTTSIAAGTVLNFEISPGGGGVTGDLASFGTVSFTGWALASAPTASGGDNWFIYQGASPTAAPTTWVFGFAHWSTNAHGQNSWQTSGVPSSTTSFLPTALTNGTNAIALTGLAGGAHQDNLVYTGTLSGNQSSLLSAITTVSNWTGSETVTQNIQAGGTNFPGPNPIFTISSTTQDKLYWLSANSVYDVVRYDVTTNSIEQTRTNVLGAGFPSEIVFNSNGSLHWYNDNFGVEHFYSIPSTFGAATNATQESSTASILNTPRYLAYDASNNRIFATEINFGSQTTFIRSFDPDGTNASANLQSFATTFTPFAGIALDVSNNEMYWADPNSNSIFKASMTTVGGVRTTIVSGLSNLRDITLDLDNRLIYWIENNGFGPYIIKSAGIDGSTAVNNASTTTLYNISASVDATELELGNSGDIFWSTTDFATGRIFQGNTAASNVTTQPTPIFSGGALFAPRLAFESVSTSSNSAPTASSFTAANGPFEDLTYTFATADFGYMDGDGDPLSNLLLETIPAAGTLYVDADNDDTFDGGEQLVNGSTVSLANLNAGNLQYIQNGSTNTSFQFEVNDGTENSTGNYVATLNVTAIPTVTLSVSPTNRFEFITTPTNITATLSNTYGANVTVNLSFSGTATGGTDYNVGSSTITINAGASSNSTTVTNVDDALFENDETVIIDIDGVTNGTENGSQQVTYTIDNDDTQPNVVFELLSIYNPTSENGGLAFVSAELDAPSGLTTVVPLMFTGTATGGGVDYSVSSSSIIIASGDTKDSVSIIGVDDAIVEGNESIIIDMEAPTNASEQGMQQVTLILSDDENISASVNDPSVTEGDAGTATLQFTVSLDAPAPTGGATVDYATSNGSAVAGSDYTAIGTTTLSFLAGESSKTVDVTVAGDETVELDETLILTLSNPTGTNIVIGDANGTGTITNDDQATVTIADVAVNENSVTATITLIVDNAVDGGFDVDVSTADGTATTADSDYTAVTSQTLTFAGTAGESETFNITLGGDTKVEADETVSISMSGLSPATVASGDIDITEGATLTINNDDQATVTIANVSGNEDDGAITVTVIVDNAVDGGFDVNVSTSDGTATTAGSDYTSVTNQRLTFAGTAGEMETFEVTPTADATTESDETVIIGMSGLSPAVVASGDIDITDGATLTILNDDNISISVNDPSVAEGDAGTATLQFTVSLDAPAPAGGATVDYATSDGTAAAGSDYTAIGTTTLSFPVGQSSQTVDIDIAGDQTVEVDEVLTLNLSNPTGTDVIIGDATGIGTITNDDQATVTIADVAVNEDNGTALITVVVDNAVDSGFDVDVNTADGTATTADSDYTAVAAQTLTFAGTAGESETFNVTLGVDAKVEIDETVSISMSGLSPVIVASGDIDITDGATLTIDNDDNATLSIVATTQAAEDATDGLFTITSSSQFSSAVTVDITVGGTATEGTDYATIGTTVVFPANQNTVTIPVDVTADNIIEGNETVIVTMMGTNNTDVTISATDDATITITDDDTAVLSIAATTQAAEDATNGIFTVSTSNQFTTNTNVTFTVGGTATSGDDFTALGSSFTFPANTSTTTITVPVIADEIDEVDETVIVTLTGTDNADVSIGTTDNATITITDNDEAPVVAPGQSFTIDEDEANSFNIGTLLATDTDAGTTFSDWTIEGGDPDGVFSIVGATGVLQILDNTNLDRETTGTYTFSITVSDGSNRSLPENVTINVNDVNDELPVVLPNQTFTITEGIANFSLVGSLSAADADFTPTTFESWLITGGNVSTDGDGDLPFALDGTTGQLTINDTDDINASQITFSLLVTVSDGVNTSLEETVTVNVNIVNDPPSFTAGADQSVLEDAGLQTIAGWATNISPGGDDESTQILTFNLTVDDPGLFDQQPTVDDNGTLSYQPVANIFGSTQITISLSDDGGTANGGSDTSGDQVFNISIASVNDAPSFTTGPDQMINPGAQDYTVANWATAITSGPANEAAQVVVFDVTNDNNALFTTQPAISNTGDLTYSVADGVSGTAMVSVSLTDDGGTASGGMDTSDEIQFTIEIGRLPQEIIFGPIEDRRLGADPIVLEATGGGSGLPVTFTIDTNPASGVASLQNNTVILEGTGTVTITAGQAGNDVFEPAPDVSRSFEIQPNELFLPTLFSPNRDNVNDLFLLRGGGDVSDIEFSVFDREGNEVFRSSSFQELSQSGWDGGDSPQGAYIWVVKGSFSDGSPILVNNEDSGIIRLVR
ncbi:MAG: Calx-beta domain-containing protein [Bacteroidota bacterium]